MILLQERLRPVIFIGYSFGGLIIKQVCTTPDGRVHF